MRSPVDSRSFDLLGVRINAQSFHDVVETVAAAPARGERLSLHFAPTSSIVSANDLPELRDALNAGIVEPDGMPLVWLGRLHGVPAERVCGPDFLPALAERSVALGGSHYFLGGAPGIADALAGRLAARFPGLRVAGTYAPPFRDLTDEEDAALVEAINAAAPDFVWVGLGSPKQDLWVASHRAKLNAPVLLAVGAAFDFHAGRRRRAPRWMQRTGTEWLFRLASEPRRLFVRYTVVNARFATLLAADVLHRWANR